MQRPDDKSSQTITYRSAFENYPGLFEALEIAASGGQAPQPIHPNTTVAMLRKV